MVQNPAAAADRHRAVTKVVLLNKLASKTAITANHETKAE